MAEPTLEDLAVLTVGYAFKSSEFVEPTEGIRLARCDNIGHGSLRWDGAKAWRPQSTEIVNSYSLELGDVVVAMDRPWIASGLKRAVVRNADLPSLLVQRVARLRAKPGVDQGFIRVLIESHRFTDHVLSVQTGTTVPHISGRQILNFRVPRLPQLAEQRAIAGVLEALDDKIESNRRIIETSMALTEITFVAWRGGLSSEESTTFGEFADVFGGATPSTSVPEYWGGDHVWVAPRDVTALDSVYLFDSERHITDLGLARSSTTLHPPGSIFMTSRATIGAFAINQVPCAPNQGFIVVRPREPATQWFLFHEMRSRVAEMQDRATGTTFRELSRGSFRDMTLSVPTDRQSFVALDDAVAHVHARAAAAAHETQSLTALRDSLLPELLSARLRVRDAENVVGAV